MRTGGTRLRTRNVRIEGSLLRTGNVRSGGTRLRTGMYASRGPDFAQEMYAAGGLDYAQGKMYARPWNHAVFLRVNHVRESSRCRPVLVCFWYNYRLSPAPFEPQSRPCKFYGVRSRIVAVAAESEINASKKQKG